MARSIKLQPARRQGAAMVTVALASAFVSIVILAIVFLNSVMAAQLEGQHASVDVTASSTPVGEGPNAPSDPDAQPAPAAVTPDQVKQLPGVTEAWTNPEYTYVKVVSDASSVNTEDPYATKGAFMEATVAKPGNDPTITIAEGRLPSAKNEVLVDSAYAKDNGVGVGDTVLIQPEYGGDPISFTISGIRDTPAAALLEPAPLIFTLDGVKQLALEDVAATTWPVYARVAPDVKPSDVAAAGTAKGLYMQTSDEIRKSNDQMKLQMAVTLSAVFGAFVAVALVTSALVVANTFAVTVAQRRRSFALLRALGSTRAQVVRVVLKDAMIVGLVGAAVGVALAYALATIGLITLRSLYSTAIPMVPPFSLTAIIVPLLLGTLMTMVAGLVPAFSATKVRPVEAMRPIEATHGKGAGVIRTVLAGLAMLVGLVLMIAAFMLALNNAPTIDSEFSSVPLLLGILGASLTMLGIVMGTLVIVPFALRMIGAVTGRIGGVPGRFAALNAGRHPRRSAATVVALVIGTALMTTMAVGAATAEKSVLAELNESAPVDVVAAAPFYTDQTSKDLAAVSGIDRAVSGLATDVTLKGKESPMTVIGMEPADFAAVSHLEGVDRELKDGEILVGKSRAEQFNLKDGDTITGSSGGTATVRVYKDMSMSLTTPATVKQLDDSPAVSVLGKFLPKDSPQRKDTDIITMSTEIQGVLNPDDAEEPTLMGEMRGVERELISSMINGLLIFVTVMLAVAVIVALVGVMNTLSLSVVERTGENALLRALGTSAAQIRAMLAWEGVIMSFLGALIGVGAGIVFGLVGARVVIPAYTQYQPGVPWLLLLGVAVLALIAGLVASVLPGRTAAKVQPAAALANRE